MAKLKLFERQATSEQLTQSAKPLFHSQLPPALANRPDDALALLKQAQMVAKHPAANGDA